MDRPCRGIESQELADANLNRLVATYRTNRIDPVEGVEIVREPAPPGRWKNLVLDALAWPLVAAMPRERVNALGTTFALHYDLRRWTWRTERCVEIALGRHAIASRSPTNVLEVGNVLPLYGVTRHVVLDKYERGAGVLNIDIVDYHPGRRFGLAVSLSTLEHVGWDEEPRDPGKAAGALQRLGAMADDLLVTIPVGVHREFEEAFVNGPFDHVQLLVRTSRRAHWASRPLAARHGVRYGAPYPCGNGILIGSRGLAERRPRSQPYGRGSNES